MFRMFRLPSCEKNAIFILFYLLYLFIQYLKRISGTYRSCCSSSKYMTIWWTNVVLETYTCTGFRMSRALRQTARTAVTERARALSCFN